MPKSKQAENSHQSKNQQQYLDDSGNNIVNDMASLYVIQELIESTIL